MMEIIKELKSDIEFNQNSLKNAIRNHQNYLAKLKSPFYDTELEDVSRAEEEIISIGLKQKRLLGRLRDEYNTYQKALKTEVIKNGIEERRFNLTNALNRARKQNISIGCSVSATSISEDPFDNLSMNSYPGHSNATKPDDITQPEFLSYFSLATHKLYREMQNKRAERKRRSTANPHFLYGNKGWDFLTHNKRKRNLFFMSQISPPHTRQFMKKLDKKTIHSVSESTNGINSNSTLDSSPTVPNLLNGLVVERVSSDHASTAFKECIVCKERGVLPVCDVCSNGFHIRCHNGPLNQTPRQCPNCFNNKEVETICTLNIPSGMGVSYVTPEIQEKLKEKKELEHKKENLISELSQLKSRYTDLEMDLKNQKAHQDQLLINQNKTKIKIKQVLYLIDSMKTSLFSDSQTHSKPLEPQN